MTKENAATWTEKKVLKSAKNCSKCRSCYINFSAHRVKVCVVVPSGLDDTVVPGRRGHHGSRSRQNQIP